MENPNQAVSLKTFDELVNNLYKRIKGHKEHDFKGHFHKCRDSFIDYIVGTMRSSLFFRFMDCKADTQATEDRLKGRLEDVSYGVNCPECGDHIRLDLVDGVKLVVSSDPCKYPEGHPEIVTYLDVPSGEILLFNDFRRIYAEDRSIDFNINTTDGCRRYSEHYASLGLIMHFVGNTCPRVYQLSDEKLQIGSFWGEDDEDHGPGTEIGDICTDLWWYCAADRDDFEKKAGKTVEQYQKEYHDTGAWPEIVRAKVKPGRYKTVGRYHMLRGADDGEGGVYSEIVYEGELK